MNAPSTPKQPKTVEVEAPCTMEAGYRFMAYYEDKSFAVTVPSGGIQAGQMFSVPYPSMDAISEVTPFFVNSHITTVEAPLGHWKDNLLDCCKHGPLHPSFLHCLCCPQLLMAQVLTRFKMNWLGDPASDWRGTFVRVGLVVLLYWSLVIFLAPPAAVWVENEETGKSELVTEQKSPPPLQLAIYNLVSWGFGLYTLFVLTRLRRKVRLRYEIPPALCGECEDCCVSFWCGPCSAAQLARQTCDYEHQSAACCSTTGLGAPPIKARKSILTV